MEPSLVIRLVVSALVLFLPASLANMAPPLARFLGIPGDKPISVKTFGAHKTYRGFLAGALASVAAALALWGAGFGWYADHAPGWAAFAGFLLGLGAMTGDAAKSAVKRLVGIRPGQPFFPWDQIDFILGSTLFLLPLVAMPMPVFLTALLITPLLHLLVNVGAYWVGLKDVWW